MASRTRATGGFTLIEVLVAAAMLGILMSVTVSLLSGTLRVNQREDQYMELQQNMRLAMQQISQDLRSTGQLHVWNQACVGTGFLCSDNAHIAAVTLDGGRTAIPFLFVGAPVTNSSETQVCDSAGFGIGDTGLVYATDPLNNAILQYRLIEVSGTKATADHALPCRLTPTVNVDTIQHAATPLPGSWAWQSASYVFHTLVVSYYVDADPTDATRTALFRRVGLNTQGAQSGLVAFDVTGLRFSYAVAPAGATTMQFYDSLTTAAAALGAGYSDMPTTAGKTFVGGMIRAVRVQMTGQSRNSLSPGGARATYILTGTVDLRRPVL